MPIHRRLPHPPTHTQTHTYTHTHTHTHQSTPSPNLLPIPFSGANQMKPQPSSCDSRFWYCCATWPLCRISKSSNPRNAVTRLAGSAVIRRKRSWNGQLNHTWSVCRCESLCAVQVTPAVAHHTYHFQLLTKGGCRRFPEDPGKVHHNIQHGGRGWCWSPTLVNIQRNVARSGGNNALETWSFMRRRVILLSWMERTVFGATERTEGCSPNMVCPCLVNARALPFYHQWYCSVDMPRLESRIPRKFWPLLFECLVILKNINPVFFCLSGRSRSVTGVETRLPGPCLWGDWKNSIFPW